MGSTWKGRKGGCALGEVIGNPVFTCAPVQNGSFLRGCGEQLFEQVPEKLFKWAGFGLNRACLSSIRRKNGRILGV